MVLKVFESQANRSADDVWRDQLRRSVRTREDLQRVLKLSDDERAGLDALQGAGGLPLGITPHFLSLMTDAPDDALRLQVVPRSSEFATTAWDLRDPLGEEELEVVPHLVHRYPDRVLLLATDRCAAYCRFCTRKRFVGQGPTPTQDELAQAIAYIAAHPEIHEVIVSGGDVMLWSDDKLAALLDRLRAIAHLDVIRLATRVLAFVPQRITPALVDVVRTIPGGAATYVLSHFNHPQELSRVGLDAAAMLVDAGVPIMNQTVLLRGVNDTHATLVALFRALTRARVRPYYLHQCDLAPGTEPFRVPLDRARALHDSLRGHLSGLSIPTLVIDIPGGLGKVPMNIVPIVQEHDDHIVLRGFRGDVARYPKA